MYRGERLINRKSFRKLISLVMGHLIFRQALNKNQLTAKRKTKGARKRMQHACLKQVCKAGSPRVSLAKAKSKVLVGSLKKCLSEEIQLLS